jgi:hypothetical protein
MRRFKMIAYFLLLGAFLAVSGCQNESKGPGNQPALQEKESTELKPLPHSALLAEITVLKEIPKTMMARGSYEISAKVKNISQEKWPAGKHDYHVKLGYRWHDLGNNLLKAEGPGILPKNLSPGEEVDLSFKITAFEKAGEYILILDMYQEKVVWFADKGSAAKKFLIKVQ